MRRMTAADWPPVGKDRVNAPPRWLLFSVRTVQESPISCERYRSSLGLSAPVSRLAANARIPHEPFNDNASFKEETRLRLWLSAKKALDATENDDGAECPYCYELTIGNGDNRNVLSESIFYWPIFFWEKNAPDREIWRWHCQSGQGLWPVRVQGGSRKDPTAKCKCYLYSRSTQSSSCIQNSIICKHD